MFDYKKKMNDDVTEVDVQRAGRSDHVISRCTTMAVLVVLLATLSVTAVVVTLKSFTHNADTPIKFNVQFSVGGDKALEEISVDQSENVVEYHVTETSPQKQSQVWVISDFNRGIQVLKVDSKSSRTVCYVTPLTHRQAPSPADFSSFSHFDDSTSKTDELYFDAIDRPVTETSVIGPKGQHLCAGVELYWIVPSDFSSQQEEEPEQTVIVTYVIRGAPSITGRMTRQRRSSSRTDQQQPGRHVFRLSDIYRRRRGRNRQGRRRNSGRS